MRFKRATQRYGRTPEPVTPYQRAGQLWDERIGSARVQAQSWRLMAFGTLMLAGGLSAALVWQSLQSRIVPYVVEVDKLGEARAVAPADVVHDPSDPQIAWFLSRFIADIRSRSLDPVLMRENWLQAYDFVGRKGAVFLGDYARASDPFARVGDETVSVQVTSVVRASDESFQVKWTERAYARGSLADTTHWTAILTVAVRPPRTAEILRKNPLGLYVEAIDWSRELDDAATGGPASKSELATGSPGMHGAAARPEPSLPGSGHSAPAIPSSPERNVP
ncbi:conjugal transfer protein TrbF [Novosphingobium malaysiense]|uniref:Conjugal transfer protein TrbF n=1 Tax=Novosphingobium malaysiense TaxID=1348853 RepID=A0A0B1ZRQ6_9SPHN|nr:conjugal transfer protein TrbF [Novosphingobium malaysiense]KHK91877.1 conjugal transfer protein TrbF [Novosphingobium malaysiense]